MAKSINNKDFEDMLTLHNEEKQEIEKKQEIQYSYKALRFLAYLQYFWDVIMTPVRSLFFGAHERISLADRMKNLDERTGMNSEKETIVSDEGKKDKRIEEELEKEKKNREERLKTETQKQFKENTLIRQEVEKLFQPYNISIQSQDNNKTFSLHDKEGNKIVTVTDLKNIKNNELERLIASGKNLSSVGKMHDFDRISIATEAAILKKQIFNIYNKPEKFVTTTVPTQNGIYKIELGPHMLSSEEAGERKIITDPKRTRISISLNNRNILMSAETTKSILEDVKASVSGWMNVIDGNSYHDEKTTLLNFSDKTTLLITTRAADLAENNVRVTINLVGKDRKNIQKTQDINLYTSEGIKTLDAFLKVPMEQDDTFYLDEHLTGENDVSASRTMAELLAMTFSPQEINVPITKDTFISALDGKTHSTRESYAYITENSNFATQICYAFKIPEDQQSEIINLQDHPDMVIGSEAQKHLLSFNDPSQLKGADIITAYQTYADLKSTSCPPRESKFEYPLHTYSIYHYDHTAELTQWNTLPMSTQEYEQTHKQPSSEITVYDRYEEIYHKELLNYEAKYNTNDTIIMKDKITDCISEGLVNKSQKYSEAYPESISYDPEKDHIEIAVEGTGKNKKPLHFNVTINMYDQNQNGQKKYFITSDNKEVKYIIKPLQNALQENPQLTDDFFHNVKCGCLENLMEKEQQKLQENKKKSEHITSEYQNKNALSNKEMTALVKSYIAEHTDNFGAVDIDRAEDEIPASEINQESIDYQAEGIDYKDYKEEELIPDEYEEYIEDDIEI